MIAGDRTFVLINEEQRQAIAYALSILAQTETENAISSRRATALRALLRPQRHTDWRGVCASLIDIYDDGTRNAPESRCYVEGAWEEAIDEARALLSLPF